MSGNFEPSAGWKFLFARHDGLSLNTKASWFDFIERNDGRIRDEYGDHIRASELKSLIENKQSEERTGLNCYKTCGCSLACKDLNANPLESLDAEGFRISNGHELF